MYRIFRRILDYLFPLGQMHKGTVIVRLYSQEPLCLERIAFTGIGVSRFRQVGAEMHIEDVSIEIPVARGEPSTLPRITRFTVALEDFPDMEAAPPLLEPIRELTRPMTLHLCGDPVDGAPLVVISGA